MNLPPAMYILGVLVYNVLNDNQFTQQKETQMAHTSSRNRNINVHVIMKKSYSKNNTAYFVAAPLFIMEKTAGFQHVRLKAVGRGEYVSAFFTYNLETKRRRLMKVSRIEDDNVSIKSAIESVLKRNALFAKTGWDKPTSVFDTQAYLAVVPTRAVPHMRSILNAVNAEDAIQFSVVVEKKEFLMFASPTVISGLVTSASEESLSEELTKVSGLGEFVKAKMNGMSKAFEDDAFDPSVEEPIEASKASAETTRKAHTGYSQYGGLTVKNSDLAVLTAAKAHVALYDVVNIFLAGPSGSGKTSLPKAFAAENDLAFYKMDVPTVGDPEEFLGRRGAKDGTTYFEKSEFITKLEAGNVVIVLDELNRIQPWIAATLFGLLDDTRKVGDFEVGKNVYIFATANIGPKFSGTFILDAALADRFWATIVTGYLPPKEEAKQLLARVKDLSEEDANLIVKIINKIRAFEETQGFGIDVSIRTSLRLASMYASSDMTMKNAVSYTICNFVRDGDIEKGIWDIVTPLVG